MAKKKQKPKKKRRAKKKKRRVKRKKVRLVRKRVRKKTRRPKRKKRVKKKVKVKKVVRRKRKAKQAAPAGLVHRTKIRVIGIGGGGGSIVSEIAPHIKRVDFVVANTDSQALREAARGARTLQFGQKLTRGLGCGMDARLGQRAAKNEKEKIAKLFQGVDLCILVSCLGGGTGSGAAPEFAKIARESGVMAFGIFTLPFKFEGGKRAYLARSSLEKLTPNLNAVSIIPNENIFQIIDKKTPLKQAFSTINKRLAENLRGLIEMIYIPGVINIDFADLKTILEGRGKLAYLNSRQAAGPARVEEALKEVLHSPLNEYSIRGAEKIIFNITASQEVGMKEIEQISQTISDFNRRAKIIFGISQDNSYRDRIRIALLAVGCGKEEKVKSKKRKRKPKSKPKPRIKRKKRRRPKPQPEPKRKRRPRRKVQPKPKPKPKPKPRKKKKVQKAKPSPSPAPETAPTEAPAKPLVRKNALDLRKEVQKTEEEMQEKERKWDIPAFLRRKPENTK